MRESAIEAVKNHMTRPGRLLLAAALLIAVGAGSVAAQAQYSDDEITIAVMDVFLQDEVLADVQLEVATERGVVTLTGVTDNLLSRRRATRLAQTVAGVRAVVNNLQVNPPEVRDEELEDRVNRAYSQDPTTEAWDVGVQVEEGVVTLDGEVDSWREKELAERVAMRVAGVREVVNNLQFTYPEERSDAEIKQEIQQALRWDARVDHGLIEVAVQEGVVRLSGVVGSAAEKRQARYDAWVTGVEDVRAEELSVQRWARDEDLRGDKYEALSDGEIAAAVEAALAVNPRTNSFEIIVKVEDGVVTLAGSVDNLKSKREAAETARSTVGVWRVKNYLRVNPSTPTDEQLEEDVQQALRSNPYVDRYDIVVTVRDGVATLVGKVDTWYEKAEADDVAARVYGVTAVNNNLKVEDGKEVYTHDPLVDEWYIYDYDWYERPDRDGTKKTDWEISEDVQDQFFWSPFVDGDQVRVTVEGGIVTLEGLVDTWAERAAATENAYEAGAVAVDNNLRVSYGPDYYAP